MDLFEPVLFRLLRSWSVYAAVFENVKSQRFSTITSSSSVPLLLPLHLSLGFILLMPWCVWWCPVRSQILCLCIYFSVLFHRRGKFNWPIFKCTLILSVNANLLLSLSSKLFPVSCVCPFLVVGVIPAGVLGAGQAPGTNGPEEGSPGGACRCQCQHVDQDGENSCDQHLSSCRESRRSPAPSSGSPRPASRSDPGCPSNCGLCART